MSLRSVLVVSLCWVFASCKVLNLEINNATKLCSSKQTVYEETEVTVIAKGDIPGADCSLIFDTHDSTGSCGICFQFENYAFFNTTLASIVLTAGSMSKVIDTTAAFPKMHMCSEDSSLSLTFSHEEGYTYSPKEPGYVFVLDIFNKCGYRGTAKSLSFDEVVRHAKGYDLRQVKEDKVMSNFIYGLVVGLCLASIFLIVLLGAWCYVKNSPNRGASKSAGMPNIGRNSSRDEPRSDVEMIAFKKDGARPEGKPLLRGGR